MGNTTSFDKLIAEPRSEKVFLAEIKVSERLSPVPAFGLANAYQCSVSNETVRLVDGSADSIKKTIIATEEDGTALTEQNSVANVQANPGSWWYDATRATYEGITNGGFASDMTGWSNYQYGTGASVAGGKAGNCAEITSSQAGVAGIIQICGVIAGDTIRVQGYVKAGTEATYRLRITNNQTGTDLYDSGDLEETNGDWSTALDSGTVTIPSGCISVRVIPSMNAPGAAETIYFDSFTSTITPGGPRVYLHPTGSDDARQHTITGFFWLYFATKGIILNNTYYEPYIESKGIPQIKQSNPKLYWGVTPVGGGSLKLNNSRGYFDQISKNFVWLNKTVRIKMGGDNLPYSEYQTIYTGKIEDIDYNRNTFDLKLISATFDLFKTLPANIYSTGTYPNIDKNAIGKPIPIMYGDFSTESLAVNPTCIDTSYANLGATTMRFKFKICDHAIQDIGQVYVDFGDGVGWQVVSHTSEDLTNAQFCIACTGPATTAGGANNSSAYRITDAEGVKVTLKGKLSGTTLIESAPGIVLDLISNVMGFSTSVINSTAIQNSRAISDSDLIVPIEKESDGKKIIEKICASDIAFFDEDENGLYRYRTWEPLLESSYKQLKDYDFLGIPKVNLDYNQLYWKIRIGYHYNSASTTYRYHEETDNEGKYIYEREETLILNTYLRNKLDTENLAQRLRSLMRGPTAKITGKLKIPIVDHLIGEKVRVTMTRAPFGTSGGWDNRYFEISGRKLSAYPVANQVDLFDIKEFGGDVGYWTSTDSGIIPWSTNWDNATVAQRDGAGYWCSTDRYASTQKTAISLDASLWW